MTIDQLLKITILFMLVIDGIIGIILWSVYR